MTCWEAWPVCLLFHLQFGPSIMNLRKHLFRAPKFHAVCLNLLPQKYSCGVFYCLLFKHFAAHLCSWEGSEQTHLAHTWSSYCCLIPGVTVRKQPKTGGSRWNLKSWQHWWKSLSPQVSWNPVSLPDQSLRRWQCSSRGTTSTVLRHLPHLLSDSGNGPRWCWMWNEARSHSSWAMHIS